LRKSGDRSFVRRSAGLEEKRRNKIEETPTGGKGVKETDEIEGGNRAKGFDLRGGKKRERRQGRGKTEGVWTVGVPTDPKKS